MTDVTSFDIAIVGGGAAGALVATRILQDGSLDLRLAIIEPSERLGEGVAYSTRQEGHLLNVIASRMSAFEEAAGHFVEFLQRDQSMLDAGESFVPRLTYARYLRETLAAQPGQERLHHLPRRVVAIEKAPEQYTLTLDNGQVVCARRVVIATGNVQKRMPALSAEASHEIISAWDWPEIASVAPGNDVCILGSGLSMVDVIVALDAAGHHGRIYVLSRHGLMPLPHAQASVRTGELKPLCAKRLSKMSKELRDQVAMDALSGAPWQWAFDRLRPYIQSMWRALPALEQRRFVRHLARYWDIHRHRVAPSIFTILVRRSRAGSLTPIAGRILEISTISDVDAVVRYQPRGMKCSAEIAVQRIINATGLEVNVTQRPDSLVTSLLSRGLVMPGPHSMGLASVGPGCAVDASGRPDPNLLLIGSLRIGDLWESVAIPELRVQSKSLADHVVASLK